MYSSEDTDRQQGSFTVSHLLYMTKNSPQREREKNVKDMQETLINIIILSNVRRNTIKTLVIICYYSFCFNLIRIWENLLICHENYIIINYNNSKICFLHIVLSWLHYICHEFGLKGRWGIKRGARPYFSFFLFF